MAESPVLYIPVGGPIVSTAQLVALADERPDSCRTMPTQRLSRDVEHVLPRRIRRGRGPRQREQEPEPARRESEQEQRERQRAVHDERSQIARERLGALREGAAESGAVEQR